MQTPSSLALLLWLCRAINAWKDSGRGREGWKDSGRAREGWRGQRTVVGLGMGQVRDGGQW
jgi:hypothetical protein